MFNNNFRDWLDRMDLIIVHWLARHCLPFLRIGLGFLSGRYMRLTLELLVFQMAGTLAPLALFPREAFMYFPYAPTLEGQYIIKNLVLIGAGLVIGSTVRGGKIVAEPLELPHRHTQLAAQALGVGRSSPSLISGDLVTSRYAHRGGKTIVFSEIAGG